ncbi:MAG TPA: hypothetical protein VN158_12815, partial [Caulobacter sp.]|nr:hypothetical protein [Caulobacter sp.]
MQQAIEAANMLVRFYAAIEDGLLGQAIGSQRLSQTMADGVVALFVFWVRAGVSGDDRFGPDPKSADVEMATWA